MEYTLVDPMDAPSRKKTQQKSSGEVRIVIAVPLASPFIYWRVVAAILEMERPSASDLMVFQGALVDRARNRLIEQMRDHPMKPTHIFFMDADIVPSPDALTRLLSHGLPIVSGLYRRRLPPYEPMAFVKRPPPQSPSSAKQPHFGVVRRGKGKVLQPISMKGPRLRNVDVVGAGCLLIRREVFEKVPAPWFTSEWREEGHLSEDFSFCEKARKVGYRIAVDTAVRPLHLEPMGIATGADGRVRFIPMD